MKTQRAQQYGVAAPRSRPARPVWLPLACLVLAGSIVAGPALASEGPADAHRAAIARILGAASGEPSASSSGAGRRLAALGKGALPALLEAADAVRPESPQAALLERAIRACGAPALRTYLLARVRADPVGTERLVALRRLGRYGDADALGLASEVAAGIDPTWLPTPRVGAAWEAALRGLLDQDPTPAELAAALRTLPPGLHGATGRVLASAAHPEALEGVLVLLDQRSPAAPALLAALTRLSPLALADLEVRRVVRPWLGAEKPAARSAAAGLAARGRALGLVLDLAELLADEHPRVRRAARRALEGLTATTVGSRPKAWRDWLAAESAWLDTARLAERLSGSEPGALAGALKDVTRHSFIAGRVAVKPVGALIRHPLAAVRSLACTALGRLGRLEASRSLVEALGDDEVRVREAAHRALRHLTGERLPAEPEAWSRVLARR